MIRNLTVKQKLYYDERCHFYKSLGVAVPTGLICDKASSMSDNEVDNWFKEGIPADYLKEINSLN